MASAGHPTPFEDRDVLCPNPVPSGYRHGRHGKYQHGRGLPFRNSVGGRGDSLRAFPSLIIRRSRTPEELESPLQNGPASIQWVFGRRGSIYPGTQSQLEDDRGLKPISLKSSGLTSSRILAPSTTPQRTICFPRRRSKSENGHRDRLPGTRHPCY